MTKEAIRLKFKGRERVLLFGIGPSRILCEDRGITVTDMHTIDINELVQDIICASLKFECLLNDKEVDFNKYEVYQWITEMEQATFQQIFDVFIKTRTVGESIYSLYLKNLEKLNSGKSEEVKGREKEKKTNLGRFRRIRNR